MIGDLTLEQWRAMLPAVQCPAGYSTSGVEQLAAQGLIQNYRTAPQAADVCTDARGQRPDQVAEQTRIRTANQNGLYMLYAAAGLLFVGDGWEKALALPLAYFGFKNYFEGLYL